MVDFNDMCEYNSSLKRSFPGCTASQLRDCVKPSLEEERPDTTIIHVGTNHLTKTNQAEEEIFNEIMMVKVCRNGDVNKIYVPSLICRPSYQERINGINSLFSLTTAMLIIIIIIISL